jgi:hypothetical protein
VPPAALKEAVRRTAPDTVVLWSQTPETAHRGQLDDVLAVRPAPKLVLAAGPGWRDLPASVLAPSDLAEAVAMITGVPVENPGA